MKSIRNGFLIIFFSFSLVSHTNCEKNNYISLDFAYDHYSLPVPRIVFSIDSIKTDVFSYPAYNFIVSENEFLSIENIVQKESPYIILDSSAVRYYDINILREGKKITYGTVNLTGSKKIFSKIIELFKSSKNYLSINRAFKELYSQLRPLGSD